jgi:hypothetical protein
VFPRPCYLSTNNYELLPGYSQVGEPAGLVKEQGSVYVHHHLLLIDAQDSLVSSSPFRSGFARLVAAAAAKQKNQTTKNKGEGKKPQGKVSYG